MRELPEHRAKSFSALESHGPDAIPPGTTPRCVPFGSGEWNFDPGALKVAFNNRTKAIIIDRPNDPAGMVFSLEESRLAGDLPRERRAPTLEAVAQRLQVPWTAKHAPIG
jgi:hypothetical protein